jgi:hypothetical protein
MNNVEEIMSKMARARTSSSYDDPMACYKCYVKHLSKASVEAEEYVEDQSRNHELSQCMGNIACAEDHAAALGLTSDKDALRTMRERMWTVDRSVPRELLNMAAKAISSLRAIESSKARKEAPAPVKPHVMDGAPDELPSNG